MLSKSLFRIHVALSTTLICWESNYWNEKVLHGTNFTFVGIRSHRVASTGIAVPDAAIPGTVARGLPPLPMPL
jgi:hypothetical protein